MEGVSLALSDNAAQAMHKAMRPEDVDVWISSLGSRVKNITEQWGMTVERNLLAGTRGLVLLCGYEQGRAVLKMPFEYSELDREHEMLRCYAVANVQRITRVYNYQPGALATYYVAPGTSVNRQRLDVDKLLIIELMQDLHRPQEGDPGRVQRLEDDINARLDKVVYRLPRITTVEGIFPDTISRARKLAQELNKDQNFLVHGDLHSGNILKATDGLVACDPKGAVGDRHYDAAMWSLKADAASPDADAWINLFAEHGYDAERIRAWIPIVALHEAVAYLYLRKSLERVDLFMSYIKELD